MVFIIQSNLSLQLNNLSHAMHSQRSKELLQLDLVNTSWSVE